MKKIFPVLLTMLLSFALLNLTPAKAQILPSIRLTAPTVVQAEIGKSFVIPLTITMGTQESILGGVRPKTDNASISVQERIINQTLPANATINTSLTGIAQSAGIYRVTLDVDASGFVFSTDVMVEVKDPDEAQKRPRFRIEKASLLPESPDLNNPFTLSIELKNTGDEPSGDVMATLDGKGNFSLQSLANQLDIPSVNTGETGAVSFMLRAKDNRASNEVTLTLSYGTYTQTQTIFLPLPDVPDPLGPPLLKIDSFTLTPAREGRFSLRLTVVNEGESAAESISLSLDAGGKAFPVAGGNVRTIRELAPSANAEVEYLLSSQGELSAHPVNITFDFLDENNAARKGSDRIFITSNLEPSLSLTGFSARTGSKEGEFTLTLNIRNGGLSVADKITVRFTGNQVSPLSKGAVLALANIPAGESANLSLLMQTKLESETYTIPFEVTYRSQTGAEHKTTDTVVVTSDSIGIALKEQAGLLPVILDRHTLSTNNVSPGSEFTLTLHIANTSNEPTGIAKITLGEARAGNTGGSVFSTADGRNVFVAESIPANGKIIKEIRLLTDNNAQAMIYSLPLTIEYEDDEGIVSAVNANVAIPVRHEGRFRILTLDVLQSASVGEAVAVSMEFANTGRINLDNVFISLEGDFNKENATFFIPSFGLGTSDFFHATLFPDTEGTLTGMIVITYDDANEVRIEKPFSIEVTPAITPAAGMPGNPRPGFAIGNFARSSFPWLYAGIAGIIVLVGIFFTLSRIKAKKRAMSPK